MLAPVSILHFKFQLTKYEMYENLITALIKTKKYLQATLVMEIATGAVSECYPVTNRVRELIAFTYIYLKTHKAALKIAH